MMQNEMIHTDRVLIVEGKYDAARLAHLTDAMILRTDGFGIYKDKQRQQLFRALAQKNGLLLLTDSDAAGFRIRNYITNLVGAQNVVQAYVPAIHGKEKRKAQPGKEGLLGVEGVDDALVRQALLDALGAEAGAVPVRPAGRQVTYTDLYELKAALLAAKENLHRPVRVGAVRQARQRRAQGPAADRAGAAAPPLQKGTGGSL